MPEGMSNPGETSQYIEWGKFHEELTTLLNRHGLDSFAGTPDFMLAELIVANLAVTASAVYQREKWFGR